MSAEQEATRAADVTGPRFPEVAVAMIGEDGNTFAVIGRVVRGLKDHGRQAEATEFSAAAFACSSADEVLALAMQTVEVY